MQKTTKALTILFLIFVISIFYISLNRDTSYNTSSLINKDLEEKVLKKIIEPTLKAIDEMNEKYIGFLYAGLMIKNNEPYLIEYNVRMGDPECQTILPLVDSDLLEIIKKLISSPSRNSSINT